MLCFVIFRGKHLGLQSHLDSHQLSTAPVKTSHQLVSAVLVGFPQNGGNLPKGKAHAPSSTEILGDSTLGDTQRGNLLC